MKIGKVLGTVVATLKLSGLQGHKLLLVKPLYPDLKPDGSPAVIAIDTVRAGEGDVVLFVDEGNSARQVLAWENGPVRAVIVGYIDEIQRAPAAS